MERVHDYVPADPLARPVCEVVMPDGICCCAPATVCDLNSPREPEERDDWPGFLCAHHARRATLDREFKEVGQSSSRSGTCPGPCD